MAGLTEQIEKILNYKTYSNKRKEDALLEMDCDLYTNIGTESTKQERDDVKRKSRMILKGIQKVNWELGSSLLYAMDK